jgi:O-antigen/teichoic acid export membrane protein
MSSAFSDHGMAVRGLERYLLRTGGVLLVGQVAFRLAVAAYTVVLVSLLSPPEYGDFAVLIAIVAITAAVADGGITRLLTRDVARRDRGREALVRGLMTLRTLWVAAVVIGLIFLILLGALPLRHGGALVGALVAVAAISEAGAAGMEAASLGGEVPRRVAIGQFLGAGILLATLAVLVTTRASVASAIAGIAIASSVRLAWNLGGWWPALRRAPRGPNLGTARQWIREAVPFLLLAMLGAIYYRLDVVILHALRGATEAASYAAAYRVLDAAIVLGGVVVSALVPRLSQLGVSEPERLWSLWLRWVRILSLVSLVPTLAVVAGAVPLADLLFGERYRAPAGSDLRLLAPSIAFVLLHSLNAAFLFALDRQRALVRLSLVNVGVNIALTATLAQLAASTGAAVATTLSSIFTFVYFVFIVRRAVAPERRREPVRAHGDKS